MVCSLHFPLIPMVAVVYLTKDEQRKIPAALEKEIEVHEEMGSAEESMEELQMSFEMISFYDVPEVQAFVDKLAKMAEQGKSIEDLKFDDVPEDMLKEVIASMGPMGYSMLIGFFLQSGDVRADDLALLTDIRHMMYGQPAIA